MHLVLDHNFSGEGRPLIFETMLFDHNGSSGCWRWSTEDDAREGHARLFQALLAGADLNAAAYQHA